MFFRTNKGLYYENSGPIDAPSIVFLHGGGAGGWMWKKHVALLSSDYHCIVPDLPEQGNSANVGPFSIEYASDCIADLIRTQAHGGKAHIVGLSEGAQILVYLLSRYPDLFDHAVCSSALLRPMPGNWMYSRSSLTLMYLMFMAPLKNLDGWIRLNMHYSAGIGDENFQDFKKSFQQTTKTGFANLMYSSMHFSLPSGLEKADVPVLIVTGKLEYKQMQLSANDLMQVLPKSTCVVVSFGVGSTLAKEHNWVLTDPDLFTNTVKTWIEDRKLPESLIT